MPFRTKDFLVFMLTVAFLVVGITATAKMDMAERTQSASVFSSTEENGEVIYEAVLPDVEVDARPSRLAALKEKIASMILPEESVPEAVVVEEEVVPTVDVPVGTINLCSNHTKINPKWSSSGLLFEVVEGARVVYRNVAVPAVLDELGQVVSSSTIQKEVVLQLPLSSFPGANKTCLDTDVVGVALDGSLMRNDEFNLYKVFGSETLIGYALDGFPIYGLNVTQKTDECGGAVATSEYRYYLSAEREGVLGCYGGTPATF